jgi:SAM-dependent methyltransferase
MAEPNNTAKHDWKPASYNEAVSFVYSNECTRAVFELLSAQPNERIVDLGCGTGELTLRLEELVGQEGLVIGVDASESMVSVCVEPAPKLSRLTFFFGHSSERPRKMGSPTCSALIYRTSCYPTSSRISQELSMVNTLCIAIRFIADAMSILAVFTNLALHWCKQNPHGAVRAAKTLLRPGGRFVGEFGGHMNGVGT